ncbi:MAG: DUF4465 domain-containing protein [Breznakibacter sp.]
MKRKLFILCMAVATATGLTWNATAQTLTLNLTGCPKDTLTGGYWIETYNDSINTLTCGDFVFSHLPAGPGASFGGYYWDGFTTGTNGDYTNYGTPCPVQPCDSTHSGSLGWVDNQWGVMAGGGIANYTGTTVDSVAKGIPYLIAYWGYHMEEEWWDMHYGDIPPNPMHCLTAKLADNSTFTPQGVFICNHPWPYWGNRFGDGFARPLDQPGDYFVLRIGAMDDAGNDFGFTVTDTLAVYDDSAFYDVRQPDNWHWVDLTELGSGVHTLYFTMETTDVSAYGYGPNTAVYFCMDKLSLEKDESSVAKAAAALKPGSETAQLPGKKAISRPNEITNSVVVDSYTGGEVLIYTTEGRNVLRTTVKAGRNTIDTSTLPAGNYLLRHGHKTLYVSKK